MPRRFILSHLISDVQAMVTNNSESGMQEKEKKKGRKAELAIEDDLLIFACRGPCIWRALPKTRKAQYLVWLSILRGPSEIRMDGNSSDSNSARSQQSSRLLEPILYHSNIYLQAMTGSSQSQPRSLTSQDGTEISHLEQYGSPSNSDI